jgi:outer membrane protein insertion porin family
MSRVVMNCSAYFVLWLPLLFSPVTAQKPTRSKASAADAYKLIALKVTGTARYTDQEILAASGLQIGENAADGDFKEAVQRLGNSGLFSGAVYSYSSSNAGTKLELQLTDIDRSKLVPTRFENFVWFTNDELQAALQRRVPLFKQLLPLTGNLPDRVEEALQAILSEKSYPGRVDYLREAQDQNGGPLTAIEYRVEEISILVRGFEFPGATPEQSALLTTAARRAIGGKYTRSGLAEVAKFDLLPVYLQRGYLKAVFGPSEARVAPQPSSGADAQDSTELRSELQVDAIIPVTPGKVYSTSGVDWKGNSAITTSQLSPLLHLPLGQPVDAVRLLDDVKAVGKLYRSRGYMAVQIKPDVQFDDEKSTVHYELNVIESDLYKMGELEIVGLDTQAKAQMQAAWTLREGQPYNADYPSKFLADTRQLLPRGVAWAINVHETPDAKDKTVDVEVRFRQQ